MSQRILDVGTRLGDPGSRRDLAWEAIAVMFHPEDVPAQRRRQSAGASTLLGMRDGKGDEKEVVDRARARWKKMGTFKTASEADPYSQQQLVGGGLVPSLLMVGDILAYVWAMDLHHKPALSRGASVSKAIAAACAGAEATVSERTLWDVWTRYRSVAHFCAAFTFRYHEADPARLDECMKTAFDENLGDTLAIAATFQRFGTNFLPHGSKKPLLDPADIWMLRGVEPVDGLLPPVLPPPLIAAAQKHRARRSVAYRR